MKIRYISTFLLIFSMLFSPNRASIVSAINKSPQPAQALPTASLVRVPQDYGDIQTAINQVSDGGIIEISAGTYNPPANGFKINDMHKGFTIRAHASDTVVINGAANRPLVLFINSAISAQKPVLFEGLIFTGGYSNTPGMAAGVTVMNGEATFVNCQFTNNRVTTVGSGGAAQFSNNSTVLVINSVFSGNSAGASGAAIEVQAHAKVYIHATQFTNNRTNLPNHATYAAGGAIHVGNSTVRISNSRFDSNQAGYVGGAIYAIGTWGDAIVTNVKVSNSTFINNQSVNDPSVPLSVPTEGGAFHTEANATAQIYDSRFINNKAMSGGAVNVYRASVQIEGSVFLGNQATSSGVGVPGGGAISVISNDVPGDLTNYPSGSVTLTDSYIQGRYTSIGTTGPIGGGVYIGGDYNRVYGANGVGKAGTVDSNRAVFTADRVAFVDLDVLKAAGGSSGGAIFSDLGKVNITNSIIAGNDALGSTSFGGAIVAIDQSDFRIFSSSIMKNSAILWGGAVFGQGSNLQVNGSQLFENTASSLGGALFTSPERNVVLNMTGALENSVLSNNNGPMIFDDDSQTGAINQMVYNGNQIYPNTSVYQDSNIGSILSVAGLNGLVINRQNGISTDKSTIDNTAFGSAPLIGSIMAVPSKLLPNGAAGDTGAMSTYLAYGWDGGTATLDGASVTGNAGWSATTGAGNHILSVNGTAFNAAVSQAPVTQATFTIDKTVFPYILNWQLTAGTFIDAMIDNHANITPAASGSVQVSPTVSDAPYWLYVMTKEGGIAIQAGMLPLLSAPSDIYILADVGGRADYGIIVMTNIGGGTLSWSATTQSPYFTLGKSSGQFTTEDTIPLLVNDQSAGTFTGQVTIDAGAAGQKIVNVHITVLPILWRIYLPNVNR